MNIEIEFKNVNCSVCGISYCLPIQYHIARTQHGGIFHCPNGHQQEMNAKGLNYLEEYRRLTKEIEELKRYNTSLLSRIDQLEAKKEEDDARNLA